MGCAVTSCVGSMDVNVVCGKLLPGQGVVAAQAYLSTDGKCSLYGRSHPPPRLLPLLPLLPPRPAIENPQSSQGLCSIEKTDFLIEEANFQHCFAFSPFDSNIKWSLLLLKNPWTTFFLRRPRLCSGAVGEIHASR